MDAGQRFDQIIKLVNEHGFMSTKELAQKMQVTETTIRRDSEELEKRGSIMRVHGGMKSIQRKPVHSTINENDMSHRTENQADKDAVARKAAELVKDGDCIFLDGGTSSAALMPYIKDKRIKIVTHSALAVSKADQPKAEIYTIGGLYIPEYQMSVGPFAEEQLQHFNFDLAFISCAGLNPASEAVYTFEANTMAMKNQAMQQAERTVLLADSSKYEIKGFCRFTDTGKFDAVISNPNPDWPEENLPENFILSSKSSQETPEAGSMD